MERVRVAAFSSSANLGPGFDALAVALDAFYDIVEARIEYDARGVIVDRVEGVYAREVPAKGNTAAAAAWRLLQLLRIKDVGVVLRVRKGIPPGKGLGSSGASAAAAVVAVSRLLRVNPPTELLLEAAGYGEQMASGTPHYDNVAASLLGGLVIVAEVEGRLAASNIKVDATFVVGVPMVEMPEGKTGVMRKVLPPRVELGRAVANWQRLALLVASMIRGDYQLAGKLMMGDEIVEPARAPYIPCYREVRSAALEAGAFGVAISGAGPSMIALVSPGAAREVASAINQAYSECGLEAIVRVARVAGPTTIVASK